jgi:hypothetical protein
MNSQWIGQSGQGGAACPNNFESVHAFVIERCQMASHLGAHHRELRAAYVDWCESNDVTPVTELTFCKALLSLGYAERSGRFRGWDGLRLI